MYFFYLFDTEPRPMECICSNCVTNNFKAWNNIFAAFFIDSNAYNMGCGCKMLKNIIAFAVLSVMLISSLLLVMLFVKNIVILCGKFFVFRENWIWSVKAAEVYLLWRSVCIIPKVCSECRSKKTMMQV